MAGLHDVDGSVIRYRNTGIVDGTGGAWLADKVGMGISRCDMGAVLILVPDRVWEWHLGLMG